ncbi:Uncharacterized protein FKW44_004702 [Caligus rogercresseyi]|uniref:Uncharacterized protein n=1 Tax=Caligus rogercresseyi TaxID=217165 RepID=A0A7T8KAS8_CALRO|nr:Uncharacterized protein FKW44_004702 [Caligus rogercresseyi]
MKLWDRYIQGSNDINGLTQNDNSKGGSPFAFPELDFPFESVDLNQMICEYEMNGLPNTH